jgi:hypothetical protein
MPTRVDFRNASAWTDFYSDHLGVLADQGPRFWQIIQSGPLYVNGIEQDPHPFSIRTSDRIIIAGDPGGYMAQAARLAGFANTWSVDYENGASGVTEVIPVILADFNVANPGQGRKLLDDIELVSGHREFEWIVSLDIMPCYDNPELGRVLDGCEFALAPTAPQSNIINLVTPLISTSEQSVEFLWQSIDNWNLERPAHSWISKNGWELR